MDTKPVYPHPIIAREGWPFIGFAVALSALVSYIWGLWSLPLWAITLFILQFFRDPPRVIPQQADAVLSPADGQIVTIENTIDPYRQVEALKISIFMNVFNVHSNRSPLDGCVQKVEYYSGTFLNAALSKASVENERNAIIIKQADGTEITVVQIAGLIARRILCYAKAGDQLHRGQRYGLIRFGSRLDVYLPITAQLNIAIGDTVKATASILATLSPRA